MLTYLFDTSAAIDIYLPPTERVRKAVRFILDQRETHRQAVIYIPSLCVAEVFNALARKHFRPREKEEHLNRQQYEKCLNQFRADIHWGKRLYVYDLNRYHVVAVDEIIPTEHHVPVEKDWDHLSTADILVIAMACELAFLNRPEETFLVTSDRRMKRVVEQLAQGSPSDWKVAGPLDAPGFRRWSPPRALNLRELGRGELTPVLRQAPLSL